MRKRFISGLTAVCIVGILITNMITSASAVISAAVVGASVAGSLLLGTLFNQMCGGQGYDFTNAFQDAVKLYTDWEENFDGSAKDPIHPVTKVEIDTSKVNIPDNIDFNSVGGTSADKMIVEMQKAINSGLEDGSIEINFDEEGNISMPTTSWCNSVTDIYDNLGVTTDNKGNRSATLLSVISPNIVSFVCGNSYSHNDIQDYEIIPFVINDDGFHCLNLRIPLDPSMSAYGFKSWTNSLFSTLCSCTAHNSDSSGNYNFSSTYSFSSDFSTLYYYSVCTYCGVTKNDETDLSKFKANFSISGKSIDFLTVHKSGWLVIDDTVQSYQNFVNSYNNGEISYELQQVKIPLTDVENTIDNMGLAGVGSGATKGSVSVNSKTKDITVTNEASKEAELVIEQGNAGDIDTPDVDSITDKFPFSLPFDIYNLVTIFVRDEQKPIFEIPIQTTLDIAGEDYKVDEKIVLDLTQFQLNGVDIIRVFTRTVTYIAFIAFLIKITPHVIKH